MTESAELLNEMREVIKRQAAELESVSRALLITHVAHHSGLDHCPLCEEEAERRAAQSDGSDGD